MPAIETDFEFGVEDLPVGSEMVLAGLTGVELVCPPATLAFPKGRVVCRALDGVGLPILGETDFDPGVANMGEKNNLV